MRGALITMRCSCGESAYAQYGDLWECPACRRLWDTKQIPAEQYWGIMREMRRMRLVVMAVALAIAAAGLALALLVGAQFLVVALMAAGFWFIWFMPFWRRRVRARARQLPTWTLQAK